MYFDIDRARFARAMARSVFGRNYVGENDLIIVVKSNDAQKKRLRDRYDELAARHSLWSDEHRSMFAEA